MRLKFCLLFLCILAAALLVQSETTIEVDANGDEYEVKRFNIEGRQLGTGRSQCVVTRRKRSSSLSRAEEAASESKDKERKQQDGASTSATTPASGVDTNTNVEDEGDYDENGNGSEVNAEPNQIEHHNAEDLEGEPDEGDAPNGDNGDGGDDYDEDEEQGTHQVVQLPIVVHQPAANAAASENTASGEHHEHGEGEVNNIVVVQSGVAPPVHPQTHAVFQLLPVNHAINAPIDYHTDNGILHFEEDISPVSTTAIWSTGDDAPVDDYEDYDYEGDDKKKKKKPSSSSDKDKDKDKKKKKKKPSKGGSKKKKGSKNKLQSNKNKKKNKNKRPTSSSVNKHRRPGNKNKRPITGNRRKGDKPSSQRRRRPYRPAYVQSHSNTVRKGNNNNDNVNSNRLSSADRNHRNTNRRRKNNLDVNDRGTRTFTKTETMTQTGTANEDKDLNCIIIRKDPPTTARPFWNVFGRNAEEDGSVGRSSHFGKRKRANLRFASRRNN